MQDTEAVRLHGPLQRKGSVGDVAAACAWLQGAGVRILQMLPLNEMAPGTQSPYSALTAMAIDPIYIRVTDVADWQGAGGWVYQGLLTGKRSFIVPSKPASLYKTPSNTAEITARLDPEVIGVAGECVDSEDFLRSAHRAEHVDPGLP